MYKVILKVFFGFLLENRLFCQGPFSYTRLQMLWTFSSSHILLFYSSNTEEGISFSVCFCEILVAHDLMGRSHTYYNLKMILVLVTKRPSLRSKCRKCFWFFSLMINLIGAGAFFKNWGKEHVLLIFMIHTNISVINERKFSKSCDSLISVFSSVTKWWKVSYYLMSLLEKNFIITIASFVLRNQQ